MQKQKWNELVSKIVSRRSVIFRFIAALVVCFVAAVQGLYFQVAPAQAVVVTRFGKPMRVLSETGPYFKLPWPIEEISIIDLRKRVYNTPFTATLTHDKKSIVLLSYVIWKVENPLLFLQALGSNEESERKLDGMITAAKNFFLGQYDLNALASTTESDIKTGEIENKIVADVKEKCRTKFGISIEQFAIKRIAFPGENTPAVLDHMRAQRLVEANRLRAEGERAAQTIRNDIAVQTELILKEGREQAGRIRGEAETKAAVIYGSAYAQSPEFYRFWRSLEGMRKVLTSGKSTLVLRSDQGFFQSLSDSSSGASREH